MTPRSVLAPASLALLLLAAVPAANAQSTQAARRVFPQNLRGEIVIPESSIEKIEDIGIRYHTNLQQFVVTDSATPQGETPDSMRQVYNVPSTGGSAVIAIVDAYHYATAQNDFNVFSQQFGLPQETSGDVLSASNQVFQIVYASGTQPKGDGSWNQEAALDIEWAHAMAPNAKIVLVEAATNSSKNLDKAVAVATGLPNVREISMSYSSSETSGEVNSDSKYTHPGIVFFAAAGDSGGITVYPSASPNVVSAGGTKIGRDRNGIFTGETGWKASGGGPSKFENRPVYQGAISGVVGSKRGTPDLSFNADPNSGVSVYDSTPYKNKSGWLIFGGTSVSSPALAGIVNLCATLNGNFANSSAEELARIYGDLGSVNFRDITSGKAGNFTCAAGWDFVTGVGSSVGTLAK